MPRPRNLPDRRDLTKRDFSRFRDDDESGVVKMDSSIKPYAPTCATQWVLAFDQSLKATGWSYFRVCPNPLHLLFEKGGVIRTNYDLTTMAGSIRAAAALEEQAFRLFQTLEIPPTLVVMESPSSPRPGIVHSNSPILAASSIYIGMYSSRQMMHLGATAVMVSGTQMKNRWTGNVAASKAQVRTALLTHFPQIEALHLVEHGYDSVGLGLFATEGAGKLITEGDLCGDD